MSKAADLASLASASETALSNRNLMINGDMQVAQRGADINSVANGGFCTDRFKISYANICDKIMLTEGLQFTSKDVGSIVANLGFEAVRSKNGMDVVIRGVDDVVDVGEIEPCDTDNVEDVANVAE